MEDDKSQTFRVRIQWPCGQILPVRIKKDATVEELIKLLKFSQTNQDEIHLFYQGNLMNPTRSVSSQCKCEDDVINVGFVRFQGISQKVDYSQWLRTQTKVREIYREALRVSDLKYDVLEASPSCNIACQEILSLCEDEFQEPYEQDITLIKENPKHKSTKPLPEFWERNDQEADLDNESGTVFIPFFATIEEAGAFFAKRKWEGWTW